MILFYDGLDHLQTTDLSLKWNKIFYGTNGQPTISSDYGFTAQGVRIYANSGIFTTFDHATTVIVGCLFRPANIQTIATSSFLCIGDAGFHHVYLALTPSGSVRIYNGLGSLLGASSISLNQNEWVHIEIKVFVSATAGTVELRINKQPAFSGSSLVTQGTDNSYANTLGLFSDVTSGSQIVNYDYDSVYVIETTSGLVTDFIGPSDISVLLVNGDGPIVQTIPSQVTNWESVNGQYPNTDVEYITFPNSNELSLFNFQDLVKRDGAIFGAALRADMRKLKGGVRQVQLVSRPGTADQVPSANYGSIDYTYANIFYITESPLYHSAIYDTHPTTGGTFTIEGINEWKGGPKRIS